MKRSVIFLALACALTLILSGSASAASPVADFSVNATSGTTPLSVQFTDTSTESPTSWAWDFNNDGTIDSILQNPTYTYNTPGDYSVKLTSTNTDGSDTIVKNNYINAANPLSSNRHIFLNVSNDGGILFDMDGARYGGPSGTYYVKADGGGLNELHLTNDVSNASGQVTVINSLSTSSSGAIYFTNTGGRGFDNDIILLVSVKGPIPDDFALHITSSGYVWTPATPGAYNPSPPTDYQHVIGIDETFTKADFLYGPQTAKPGPGTLGVWSLPLYYGQDINDPSTAGYLMFIDLKAGNMYPSKFPGVTLVDNGAVKVEYSFTNLTTTAAFNGYGWCSAANQDEGISWTNQITGSTASGYSINYAPVTPVADFTADNTNGNAPLIVQFSDASTNSPTSWAWDFNNDGIVDSNSQNPQWTFNTPGTYIVKLTASNLAGTDDEIKEGYITVNEPTPVAQFTGTPTTGTAPLIVSFTNTSSDATGYAWDFDNNGTVDSTETNPSWTYGTAGTYTVKLTVTGPGGSDDEVKTDYITVSAPAAPVAAFTADKTTGLVPLIVSFTNTSSDATGYAWDFDNNGTVDSTETNPSWTYGTAGTYTVKLTVTGPGGSDDEVKTSYITVNKSNLSDLLATEMKVTNSSYVNYSLVEVEISNIGLKTAGWFDVTLYDNEIQVGQQYTYWLASDNIRTLYFIWSPSTIGEHNLKAVIDQNNSIQESNENNNQITLLFDNRPDLTPTELKAKNLPFNYCYVTVDVTNNGEDLTEFYDVTLYDNGTQVGQQKVYGLKTGETKTVTFLCKLTSASTHNLQTTTDATSAIPETNETNNTLTKQI